MFHRPNTHVIVACAVHARPSTDSRALLTNQIRTCIKSLSPRCSNVVLSFLHTVRTFPSFWSAHHQTSSCSHDKLHSHVVGKRDENVFKSDAVIWWAAIFRTPSSMFDKLLHLSESQGSAMSRLRSHHLREAARGVVFFVMQSATC